MADKTQKELIREMHQGLYGVPDTEDKGICGDIKELKVQLQLINGRTRTTETRSKVNRALISAIISIPGIGAGITKLIGMW